jgi:hypothetical protein
MLRYVSRCAIFTSILNVWFGHFVIMLFPSVPPKLFLPLGTEKRGLAPDVT